MTPKEFAEKWFKTIDAKDYDGLRSLISSNHKFVNPATPDALIGESHIGMIQGMMSAFTGGHRIEQILSEGEWVVTRGRWVGTHTGEFNGIPATGNKVNFTFMDTMHVVNGKLAEEFMEWNAMTLMTQIGAIPQPA
jgi:predicted ester cyclase